MNCQIKINSSGNIYKVENPQGKESTLYKQALQKTADSKKALDIWATAYSEQYISANGEWAQEPKLKDVMSFITNYNAQEKRLQKTDIDNLRNNTLALPFNSVGEILNQLQILYVDGILTLTEQGLRRTNLYTEAEIKTLLSDVEAQNNLKNLIQKLKAEDNPQEALVIYSSNELTRITDNSKLVGIGKFAVENPFKVDEQLRELVGGIENREVFEQRLENAPEQIKNRYFTDNTYADDLFEFYSSLDRTPLLTENENGEIEATLKNNILSFTKQALVIGKDSTYLNRVVDFLRGVPQDVWDISPIEVEDMLLRAEDYASDFGIDIVGLSEQNPSYDDMMSLLDEISFLSKKAEQGIVEENDIEQFADKYNVVFESNLTPIVSAEKVSATNQGRKLFKVNTTKTEQELFDEDNLLKVSEDIYQRVAKIEDLEQVYEMTEDLIAVNENIIPQEARQDFRMWVKQQGDEMLTLYKVAFGHPLKFEIEQKTPTELNIENEEYLKTDFIADFAQKQIQEKQKDSLLYNKVYSHFTLTDKGIYLKDQDPYSVEEIKLFLPENDKLRDYIKLSKDKSLKLLEDAVEVEPTREFYVNNPEQLEDKALQYQMSEDSDYVAVSNLKDNFIRIDRDVFEKVKDFENLSIFKVLPRNESREYNISKIEPVTSSGIKLKNFENMLRNPQKTEINKDYSAKEEQQINEEIDECV